MNENVQVCPSCNRRTDDAYDKTDISEGRNRLVNLYNNIIRGLKPEQRKMINLMLVIVLVVFASTPILSFCSFHNTAIFLLIQALIAGLCMATVVVDFLKWKNFKLTERADERQRLGNEGFWAKRFDAIEMLPEIHRMTILIVLILMISMFVFCPFLAFDMTVAISVLSISLIGFFFTITVLVKIFRWQIEYSKQLAQRERKIKEEMKKKIDREAKEVNIEPPTCEEKKIDVNEVDEFGVPNKTDAFLTVRDFMSFKILITSRLVTALWLLSSGVVIWYLFVSEIIDDYGYKFILAVIVLLVTRILCEVIGLPFFIMDSIRDVRDELKKLNNKQRCRGEA